MQAENEAEFYFMRSSNVTVMSSAKALFITTPKSSFSITANVGLVKTILTRLHDKMTIAGLVEATSANEQQVKGLIEELSKRGVCEKVADGTPNRVTAINLGIKRLGLCVCGSLSALAIPSIIARVRALSTTAIEVIATDNLSRFIKVDALRHMGVRVWSDPHQSQADIAVPHAWLADNCDLILVAPATAHTIHKLATGACSDLVSLVAAGTTAPVVVAPAMHPRMWSHAPVRNNVSALREAGMFVLEPTLGYSAGLEGFHVGACAITSDSVIDILAWLSQTIIKRTLEPPQRPAPNLTT